MARNSARRRHPTDTIKGVRARQAAAPPIDPHGGLTGEDRELSIVLEVLKAQAQRDGNWKPYNEMLKIWQERDASAAQSAGDRPGDPSQAGPKHHQPVPRRNRLLQLPCRTVGRRRPLLPCAMCAR
jgi:hypothetical protein